MAGKQKKGGRHTPKGGPPPASAGRKSSRDENPPQVGRRPSPPALLFLIAALWLACGVLVATKLDASWRLVPTIVFIGVGLFYLRAGLQTVVRRERGVEAHDD